MSNHPKKRLGQHFLFDKNIIRKIVTHFSPSPNDLIVEIGAGHGALSEELYKQCKNLILIEVDENLVDELRIKFPATRIINKDILECDFSKEFFNSKFRIIGNLPYYITSQILFKIFDSRQIIEDVLIMIQKEVAERLIAKPSTKEYGILTVLTNLYTDTEILFHVSRNVFYPKPEVESSVVHLKMKSNIDITREEEQILRKIIKAAFNQRRKTLRNSLKSLFSDEVKENSNKFFSLDFDFSRRAEELNLDEFIYLAKNFYQICRNK